MGFNSGFKGLIDTLPLGFEWLINNVEIYIHIFFLIRDCRVFTGFGLKYVAPSLSCHVRLPSGAGPERYKNQCSTVAVNNPHINKLTYSANKI